VSAVEDWLAAERAIGDAGAVAEAAAALDPTSAALLRAMEALDAGDADAVEALATELRTDHPDIAAVLDVALAPRTGVDPALNRSAPETVELPLPDLLAVFAEARVGRPSRPSARLAEEAGYRPVLHAVFTLMTDDRSEVYANPFLRHLLPRADQLVLASRAQQMLGHTAVDRLRHFLGDLAIRLEPPRWPRVVETKTPGDVDWWARTRSPWTADHDATVDTLLEADEPTRLAAVGTILRRVARDLPHGRLANLSRPVRAAVSLVWKTEAPSALKAQLLSLQMRTDHFDPEVETSSVPLLLGVWGARDELSPRARAVVAEALLDAPRGELPDEALGEVAMAAMAQTPTSERAGELLLELAARLPPDVLIQGLEDAAADAHRQRHLAALHAASAGFAPISLRAIAPLLDRPGTAPDEVAVSQVLRTVTGTLSRREELPEGTEAAFATAMTALAAAGVSARPWGPVAAVPRWADAVSPRAREVALARTNPISLDPEETAASLCVLGAWGGDDALREGVRRLGRRLRQLEPPDAEDLALQTLGWVYAWNAEGGREATSGRLKPLSMYLLRKGGASAASASARLTPGVPATAGVLDWYLQEGQQVTRAGAWRRLLRGLLAVPPDLADDFRRLSDHADLSGANSLPAAAALLQQVLQDEVDRAAGSLP
jgi:hypothetical protein